MLHLHAGPRIRCVTGCRSRVSVCMSTWLVCGSPPVRLFYRPRKRTSRGWDEVKQASRSTSAMHRFESVFFLWHLGTRYQASTAQKEAATGSAGPRLRGRGQQGKAGLQLGDEWVACCNTLLDFQTLVCSLRTVFLPRVAGWHWPASV